MNFNVYFIVLITSLLYNGYILFIKEIFLKGGSYMTSAELILILVERLIESEKKQLETEINNQNQNSAD